jgi:probable 2-oxoglutarate dehydrogenase E1 component DHKTD1
MYKIINKRKSVPNMYKEQIVNEEKLIDEQTIDNEVNKFRSNLENCLDQVVKSTHVIEPRNTYLNKKWSNMNLPSSQSITNWETGCDIEFLKFIGARSVAYPNDFVCIKTLFSSYK